LKTEPSAQGNADLSKKPGLEVAEKQQIYNIRITLTSREYKNLEKVCADLIEEAHKKKIRVKGPVRLPTKILRIHTRKSPCGEGTETWHHYQMRIHKRLIDLKTSSSDVKVITSIPIEPNVEIDVEVTE